MKKINISRQHFYLLALSTLLLIFVLLFAFLLLIPKGKEYRVEKANLKKVSRELSKYQNFHDETYDALKKLQSENRRIILAFEAPFNAQRFQESHQSYFQSLNISKANQESNESEFSVYEVNATSKIDSPRGFYDFLDALNKSEWIVAVNFPIHFKRENNLIESSFTMKVYSSPKKIEKSKTMLRSKELFE